MILIVAFFVPLLLTWKAPTWDGQTVVGFPLTVYSYGGLCFDNCETFSFFNLIIDLIFIFGVSFIINHLFTKINKKSK